MAHPIWKDYILRYPNAQSVAFTIAYNDTVIYEGVAIGRPSQNTIEVKINDICADYVQVAFPATFPAQGSTSQPYVYAFNIEAVVEDSEGERTTKEEDVEFFYDWSYDRLRDYERMRVISAPIVRKIPRNAPLLYTAIDGDTSIELLQNGAFSRAFSNAFAIGDSSIFSATPIANNIFDLSGIATEKDTTVVVKSGSNAVPIQYTLVDGCYRYMLYYLNAYGGWDFLLVEGKDMQTDNYTRHTLGRSYTNDYSLVKADRATRNYRNDITRKWQLHTLWIDDAGAQNMHHLLGSTDVYLYDLQQSSLFPVTLSNSNCEYKTYSNSGNQLVRFDIDATLAQTITRR